MLFLSVTSKNSATSFAQLKLNGSAYKETFYAKPVEKKRWSCLA